MPTEMRDAIVVVTGASSGIRRATALAFARAGARVVLGRGCRRPPGVRRRGAFGRIEVWVNNVGVDAVGRFRSRSAGSGHGSPPRPLDRPGALAF
jgi:hypothetical protein